MSTATLERKGGSGPALVIPGMEHKAASATPALAAPHSGLLEVDEANGLVRAIVSVTGIVDNVDDRILPGAYTKTLKIRKPKGVWSHDWKDWVSRTEEIEEYPPGDERLPKQTKDGKPWPAEAGALVVTTRFNMKSARSREAFQAVEFFSETDECEWSIGYVVPPGQATKGRDGVRNIKSLDLFEYGPVLFGAASESMTLSVKSLAVGDTVVPVKVVDPDEPTEEESALYAAAEGEIDWDEIDQAALAAEAHSTDPEIKALLHRRTLLGLGGMGTIEAKSDAALPDGSFPIRSTGDLTAAVRAYPRAADRVEAKAHIVGRALALGATDALPKGWLPEEFKAEGGADANKGGAEKLRRYWTSGEGAAKIKWGTDGDFDRCVRLLSKHMGTRAKGYCNLRHQDAVGAPPGKGHAGEKTLIVEPITVDDLLNGYDPTIEAKSTPAVETKDVPVADTGEVKMYGGASLPGSYEQRQRAVRAAAAKALRGDLVETHSDGYSRYEWSDVDLVATFDDHAIVSRYKWGPGPTEVESFDVPYTLDTESIEADAVLGEPEPVHLSTVTVVEGKSLGEPIPVDAFDTLPDLVVDVAQQVKTRLSTGEIETKAGRVLSGANEARLRAAAEHLFAVLRAAGIAVDTDKPLPTASVTPDSTAPSAAPAATGGAAPEAKTAEPDAMEGKVLLDPALLARGNAIIAEVVLGDV